jgi:hypothetical protein
MFLFIGIDTFTKRMEATPVGAPGPSDPTPPGGSPSTFLHWWWVLSDLQLWHLPGAHRRCFHIDGGRTVDCQVKR